MTDARTISQWTGWISLEEIDFLERLAKSLKANHTIKIVNIGAGHAISGLTLRSVRPDAVLFTIDINAEESPLGGLGNELKQMKEEGLDKENYYPILGDSKIVGKEWPYGKVDMVFIDGDHSYEGCKGDIETWMRKLHTNGIIAVHDFSHFTESQFPGVVRAVVELLLDKYILIGGTDRIIAFRKARL